MATERFHMKVAVYLVLRDADKVLLSLRKGTGWKDGWFSLVAGHVEAGESVEAAMIREAHEEAGIAVSPQNLRHVFTMHRMGADFKDDYIDIFFECESWAGELRNAEPEKCGGLEWVSITNVPENTLGYVTYVLENYPKGLSYSTMEKE